MAKPISETPILKGNDARVFITDLLHSVMSTPTKEEILKRDEELKALEEAYQRLKSIFSSDSRPY